MYSKCSFYVLLRFYCIPSENEFKMNVSDKGDKITDKKTDDNISVTALAPESPLNSDFQFFPGDLNRVLSRVLS